MMESCAPSLKNFWLKGSQISNPQHLLVMSIIEKMPHLTTLGYEIPKEMDTLMFPALQSLSQLTLIGAGADAIPASLRHFTSLHCLSLTEFGIEALPDWLGSLPSLETLYLSKCPKLSRLASNNTNIAELHISHCPLLTKALEQPRRTDLNSEWSKISHIPNVHLDFQPISLQATTSAPVLLDMFKIG